MLKIVSDFDISNSTKETPSIRCISINEFIKHQMIFVVHEMIELLLTKISYSSFLISWISMMNQIISWISMINRSTYQILFISFMETCLPMLIFETLLLLFFPKKNMMKQNSQNLKDLIILYTILKKSLPFFQEYHILNVVLKHFTKDIFILNKTLNIF